MIPNEGGEGPPVESAPRTCGDDPTYVISGNLTKECSPHLRG